MSRTVYFDISEKVWAVDIEGDDLPSTVIWCLCAVNVRTGDSVELTDKDEITDWINQRKSEGCKFVGHNIIGYDAPTCNRLLGTNLTSGDIIDTLVLSMMYSPSIDGGHSLEAWGVRLKFPKSEFNDFSKLTPEMVKYCFRDAQLCRRIYIELVKRMLKVGYTEASVKLEHQSWMLIKKQQEVGFAFDITEANILYAKLRNIEEEIKEQIYEIWPPTLEIVATYNRPYKKDGTDSAQLIRHREQFERVEVYPDGSGYDCYGWVSFNIGSPIQRVEKLVDSGWECLPDERTPTGNPKPTSKGQLVPSLQRFVQESENNGPRLIAKWIEINARANMVNTWIEAYNDKTGCIHGSLWMANTLRYRHSNPNTANIPAVRVDKEEKPILGIDGSFTFEARNLWTVRDKRTRSLVGVDAKGIQLRVLAHYLNNPVFTDAVLNGDPHSYNQEIGGFATRAMAKTFIYAFLLGAGDAKVGQIIGDNARMGREVKARFVSNFPGLSELMDRLQREVDSTGRIQLIDGASLIVTAPHTRLGYLLQGDENRIMKRAAVNIAREISRRNIDALKVGDIHDEFQFDTLNKDVEEFVNEICPTAFASSGVHYNYRVPIECSSAVGLTWACTH